jgi:hypothetical protein
MKRLFYLIAIKFWFVSFFSSAQKINIDYYVVDTSKIKTDLLSITKSFESQKEFSNVNLNFKLYSKSDFKDSLWNNKKRQVKLLFDKVGCNFNITNSLKGNEDLMLRLNGQGKNILICNKSTFNLLNLESSFEFQNLSMKSDLQLFEKIKEILKEKRKTDLNILIIQNDFNYIEPRISLGTKKIESDGKTPQQITYKTSSLISKLNLGNGLTIKNNSTLSAISNQEMISIVSYVDELGCNSNIDTVNFSLSKSCKCDSDYGKLSISKKYLNTMKIVEIKDPRVDYKWKISPQQNGTSAYCLIINDLCFDALELTFESSDKKSELNNNTPIRIDKSDMTKYSDPDAWEFCFDLSIDYEHIKNPKLHTILKISPIVNNEVCRNRAISEKIKFSACSVNGEE